MRLKALAILLLIFINRAFAQVDLNCQPDSLKRIQIMEKQIPNEFTCYMELERGSSINLGTGFLIHPRVVLTAGHNLAWYPLGKRFPFLFSKVKGATLYFGSLDSNRYTFKQHVIFKRNRSSFFKRNYWLKGNILRDFAIIILPNDSTYQAVNGHFQINSDADRDLKTIHITGSPGDKDEHTMWTSESDHFAIHNGCIQYDLYTEKRNSGSPIWILTPQGYKAIGIHSRSYGSCNAGVLLDNRTMKQIREWCLSVGIEL